MLFYYLLFIICLLFSICLLLGYLFIYLVADVPAKVAARRVCLVAVAAPVAARGGGGAPREGEHGVGPVCIGAQS